MIKRKINNKPICIIKNQIVNNSFFPTNSEIIKVNDYTIKHKSELNREFGKALRKIRDNFGGKK